MFLRKNTVLLHVSTMIIKAQISWSNKFRKITGSRSRCCWGRRRDAAAAMGLDNIFVPSVLALVGDRGRFLHVVRIFTATHKRRDRVEGRPKAIAIAPEVIGHEVFVDLAAVAQDAIASTVATWLNVCDYKDAWNESFTIKMNLKQTIFGSKNNLLTK